jgi:hypothetical protein
MKVVIQKGKNGLGYRATTDVNPSGVYFGDSVAEVFSEAVRANLEKIDIQIEYGPDYEADPDHYP